MTTTILADGRTVKADECCDLETALCGSNDVPELITRQVPMTLSQSMRPPLVTVWFLTCQCCEGLGAHTWSPASYYNGRPGPDSGEYGCEPCKGTGEFKVEIP